MRFVPTICDVNRIANIALAVLAVVVFGAAVYVVTNNDAPTTHASTGGSVAARQTPIGSLSATFSSAPSLGVESTATGSSSTPPNHSSQVIAFLGDDWTAGSGASTKSLRFTTLLCAQLNAVERNFGVDGTGYAKSSDTGGAYPSRVNAIVAANPQVVIVSGGRNDSSDDGATAAAAVHALFAKLHAKLPDAVLIGVAPFWGDSDLPPEMVALSTAVNKGVTDAGGSYIDIADPIHGHPNFMADDADPNDKGYAAIATALASQVSLLLPH
jgi:lysophospholipase L1-like esterase